MAEQTVTKADWKANLQNIGAKQGFFKDLGSQHSVLHVKRGDTLLVTFENLDDVYKTEANDRMPWGYGFVEKQGWSMLGMMAHTWTWYRDEAVFNFFDQLRDDGFFKGFKRVVFYGASMGAYAASVFSAAAPGAEVILISPQATLDREITSWETRYFRVWKRDFGGRYAYGPDQVAAARHVSLFYDPYSPLDAMHAALFRGDNITKYRCRFLGHRIASLWLHMGVLKSVVLGCVEGTLTPAKFYQLMRARWDTPRYKKELLAILKQRRKPQWTAYYCQAILNRQRGPAFRKALREANAQLGR